MKDSQPIGTCVVLLNSQGQVLLGKRKNSYKAGYYGLPGGHVELNEPIISAIQREIEEETGLIVKKPEYVGVVRESQTDHDFIHFVYTASNITKEPQLCEPEKCEGWEWIDIEAVDESVLPGHLAAISLYKNNEKLADLTTA